MELLLKKEGLKMSDTAPAPQRKKKSLFRSMTVYSTILWVGAYFAAKNYYRLNDLEPNPDVMEGIMLIGIAAIAIFMRRGLISMMDSPMPGETEETRQRMPKPIYRSMTVLSAILMVVAWCGAKFYFADFEEIGQGVLVVGVAAICIFMRRGILNALG